MSVADIKEAQADLSGLIERAAQSGSEITLYQGDLPVAKIVPIYSRKEPRKPGAWKGKVWMAPDLDETSQEFIDLFENGPIFPPDTES